MKQNQVILLVAEGKWQITVDYCKINSIRDPYIDAGLTVKEWIQANGRHDSFLFSFNMSKGFNQIMLKKLNGNYSFHIPV